MQHITKAFLIVLSLLLSSCSSLYGDKGIIQNRSTDYLKAHSVPPLQIPPGLSSSTIHETYPVSNKDPSGQKNISLVPPGLY